MSLGHDIAAVAAYGTRSGVQCEPSGDWIQVWGGSRFYPADPRVEHVFITDIAHALSNINRFAGHTIYPYSVAQHSVYVSHEVPPEHALAALLHDAPEAYIVDLPRPVKNMLPGYREIEDRVWRCIAERFHVPADLPQCVKEADNNVLLAEKDQLLTPTTDTWNIPGVAADVKIVPWSWRESKQRFLKRFDQLYQAA